VAAARAAKTLPVIERLLAAGHNRAACNKAIAAFQAQLAYEERWRPGEAQALYEAWAEQFLAWVREMPSYEARAQAAGGPRGSR